MMNLPYKTTRDLVIELRTSYLPGLHVLPYNRFDMDHSVHWWLSPTSDKIAFPFGKATSTTDRAWIGKDDVFCGFNVEKGVLQEGVTRQAEVMTNDWAWHRFVKRANAPLAGLIGEAIEKTGLDLKIGLQCGIAGADVAWESLWFDVVDNRLVQRSYKPVDGILAPVAASTDFESFADALRSIDGKPTAFHWIDLGVGSTFTMNRSGPDDTAVCAELLKTFNPWMHASS